MGTLALSIPYSN